jgi:hypothetical protein
MADSPHNKKAEKLGKESNPNIKRININYHLKPNEQHK